MVQAYPAAEDMLAFVNHIAQDVGEPSANELLNPQVGCAACRSALYGVWRGFLCGTGLIHWDLPPVLQPAESSAGATMALSGDAVLGTI